MRLPALTMLVLLAACDGKFSGDGPAPEARTAEFAGSDACRGCHATQYDSWLGSHHDLAMQPARPDTVRGDFGDAHFDYFGTRTRFITENGAFFVITENASGVSDTFAVQYTFGIEPLQQYLVEIGGGRLQALPFAWDARALSVGGQRWFHLYPDEPVTAGHPLHWAGREQNWNYQCAECHSTNVRMNYDVASDTFDTAYSAIDVGCEACHGPGSRHMAQAELGIFSDTRGLDVDLDDHGRAAWVINAKTGIAERSEPSMTPPRQPEACGRCHARRGRLTDDYVYGRPLTHTHLPALLEQPLYFTDGQIRDEVYVYGSFLQSAMYRAGVTCGDCHDPHSAKLVTGGGPDSVCAKCHLRSRFDDRSHHGHGPDQVACVACHMPARLYMVVDARRDHSFRIPRPDLSDVTEAPHACGACHADRDAGWALAALRRWGSGDSIGSPHYGTALAAAERGAANGVLVDAIRRPETPGIARATALARMSAPLSRSAMVAIAAGLDDADPLVRIGALRGARWLAPDARVSHAAPLLDDSVRGVRTEAAQVLADASELLIASQRRAFSRAADEYRQGQSSILNRPEAHLNLGSFEAALGNLGAARSHFEAALRLQPRFTAAIVNLVDVLRRLGDDRTGERLLREALVAAPGSAVLRHALGLLLVRTGRSDAALEDFRLAAELAPDVPRYVYVYAVALNSSGEESNAIRVLQSARHRFPSDFDLAWALAMMLRDRGQLEHALDVAVELANSYPEHPDLHALIETLRGQSGN